jgi:hypothetical protein
MCWTDWWTVEVEMMSMSGREPQEGAGAMVSLEEHVNLRGNHAGAQVGAGEGRHLC